MGVAQPGFVVSQQLPELLKALGLDLPDPLTGHAELAADGIEGLRIAIIEPEAQGQDFLKWQSA